MLYTYVVCGLTEINQKMLYEKDNIIEELWTAAANNVTTATIMGLIWLWKTSPIYIVMDFSFLLKSYKKGREVIVIV